MPAGAFQTALQYASAPLSNQKAKGAGIVVLCSISDIGVNGPAVVNVGAITMAILVVGCFAVCARVVARGNGALPLHRLYLVRGVLALSAYAIPLSVLGVLHHLIAKFDPRFRLSGELLAIASAAVGLSALVVFLAYLRPRIRNFSRNIKLMTEQRRHGTILVSELDALYVPSGSRPHAVGTAVTSAAAMLGAYVVAKSSLFALFYVSVELLLWVLFLRACISLGYESTRVLTLGEKVRSLIVLSGNGATPATVRR